MLPIKPCIIIPPQEQSSSTPPLSAQDCLDLFGFDSAAETTSAVSVSPTTMDAPSLPISYCCSIPGCSKVFEKNYNLNSHSKVHCGMQHAFVLMESVEKPYACNVCPASFKRKHDFRRHLRLVHCQCPDCLLSFPQRLSLKKHISSLICA